METKSPGIVVRRCNLRTAEASHYVFKVHQEANKKAFDRKGLDAWNDYIKIDMLDLATKDADELQDEKDDYIHAMRGANQTVDQAMNASDAYVRAKFKKAKALLATGDAKDYVEAWYQFGLGLHTLQDATSPAHGGGPTLEK